MTLPQPIRATILFVLLLLTLGLHLACQARTQHPAIASRPTPAVSKPRPTVPMQLAARDSVEPTESPSADKTALVTMVSRSDRSAVLQDRDGIVHLEVTLRTANPPKTQARKPVDMAVILDRSGSMSGTKIAYAKVALKQLIERLDVSDRLGIVAYDSSGLVLVPLQAATRSAKFKWHNLIDRIEVRGSTNMSEGMDLAQDMLEETRQLDRNVRVLLLSDGLANAGDASLTGLTRRARRAIGGEYVLSTMGIGEDFDERLMTQLATAGDGAFYYLAKLEVLASFFEAEFATAATTVATRGRLRLHLTPGARLVDAMGLSFESVGDAIEIPVGSLYAGHERTIWLTLQLPTDQLGTRALGRVTFDYRGADGTSDGRSEELPKIACVDDWDLYRDGIDKSVWERAVVEEELARSEERLGDAIASGNPEDVDREVARAQEHQKLAESLDSKKVVSAIRRFDSSASSARVSQLAAAPIRNLAAKRQKTNGYVKRNGSKYVKSDPMAGY